MTRDKAIKALDDAFASEVQKLFSVFRFEVTSTSGKNRDTALDYFSKGFQRCVECYRDSLVVIVQEIPRAES